MDKALVIDDNRNTADALVGMLDMLGISARAAYGSSPAMALLAEQTPLLILLDINMPGVNGIEILGYLQREPRLSKTPVVVITSDDQPETRLKVSASGAKAMILKPVPFAKLEAVLKAIHVL